MLVNGQAQRWWALSSGFGTGGQGTDNRLTINSQFGELTSEIVNTGTIAGNIFYSNGAHELANGAGGRITGIIDVDQRNTIVTVRTCAIGASGCFRAGSVIGTAVIGNPAAEKPTLRALSVITGIAGNTATYQVTIWGDRTFEFENAGLMTGDLTVRTAAAGTVDGFATTGSSIGLSVDDRHSTSVQSGLGFGVEIPLATDTSEVSLELEAKWQHEFADTSHEIVAHFLGGPSFAVSTEDEDRDSAELGIGLEFTSESELAASAGYEMEVASEGISSQQAVFKLGLTF